MAKVVKLAASANDPPRPLATEGTKFWRAVMSEYAFDDAAGVAQLMQICEAIDRLDAIGRRIADDGIVVEGPRGGTRPHPLLAAEVSTRAFIAREIRALGLGFEPLKDIGRPGLGGWTGR